MANVHCNVFISAIVEIADCSSDLVSVHIPGKIVCYPVSLVINNTEPGRDHELSLYALHQLLEYQLRIVAKNIDDVHAKRVIEQPTTKGQLQ